MAFTGKFTSVFCVVKLRMKFLFSHRGMKLVNPLFD